MENTLATRVKTIKRIMIYLVIRATFRIGGTGLILGQKGICAAADRSGNTGSAALLQQNHQNDPQRSERQQGAHEEFIPLHKRRNTSITAIYYYYIT